MKALITGASGLIGSALVKRLHDAGHLLFCFSRSAQQSKKNISWIRHDLAKDCWKTIPPLDIDVVYHLAGQTSSHVAFRDPKLDAEINIIGAINLFEYLRVHSPGAFVVVAGTATEVGITDVLPINASMIDSPITFYDIGKLAAELYLMQYIREGLLRGCALRLANVYGGTSSAQQVDRGILDKIYNLVRERKTVKIYGDGSYLRDYIYIEDVVSALIAAGNNSDRTCGRHFCIGTGHGTSLKDAFLKVATIASGREYSPLDFEHVAPPRGTSAIEFRDSIVDSSDFSKLTGWVPKYNLDEGLRESYQRLGEC